MSEIKNPYINALRDFKRGFQRAPPPKINDRTTLVRVSPAPDAVSDEVPPSTPKSFGSVTELDARDKNFDESDDEEDEEDFEGKKRSPCCEMLVTIVKCFAKLILVGLYLVAGAYMFQYLELTNETSNCYQTIATYSQLVNTTMNRFLVMFQQNLDAGTMADVSVALLNRFGSNARSFGTNPFKECDKIGQSGATYRWSFSNSLMYSATVISSIGYGYLFPLTDWGKLSTIAYALLGIPVMVIFLAAIGDILGKAFRYIYANMCCCVACISKKVDRKKGKVVEVEKSSSANGTLKNAITTSKKADGGNKQSISKPRQSRNMGTTFANVEINDSEEPAQLRLKEKKMPPRSNAAAAITQEKWIDEEVKAEEDTAEPEEDTSNIIDQLQVPVTFLLIIVIAFLFVGVGVFASQEWNLQDSVYFCFISLSTIGFGDYVPDRDQPDSDLLLTNTIAAIAYILVGMAILSMCLNVIQDDLVNKAEWFGKKLQYIKGRCCKKSAEKE